MKYDVDYFIAKFEAIPEEYWCIFGRHKGDQHCAHGWCDSNLPDEEKGLINVFFPLKKGYGVAGINNGLDGRYPQPTPRQRILAALYDIKKLQNPEVK